jgi:tol-pal system protein YbgF
MLALTKRELSTMTRRSSAVAMSIALLLAAVPRPAAAADKVHQQMLAEIRMLQEQQSQLLALVGGLNDTLKAVTAKIDDQGNVNRKAFADQKVLVDGIAEGVRVLREKADDTNVRLASMTQEIEAMRQTIATMPAPTAAPPSGDPAAAAAATDTPPAGTSPPGAAPAGGRPQTAPPPLVSPERMYQAAYSDYTVGQYDLAIIGLKAFIDTFPQSDRADDAQLYIGNSLAYQAKYPEAVVAYQKVISSYPQGDTVPQAYWKLGQAYETGLKQIELARKAYETLIQKYPTSNEAQLAKQRMAGLDRRQ